MEGVKKHERDASPEVAFSFWMPIKSLISEDAEACRDIPCRPQHYESRSTQGASFAIREISSDFPFNACVTFVDPYSDPTSKSECSKAAMAKANKQIVQFASTVGEDSEVTEHKASFVIPHKHSSYQAAPVKVALVYKFSRDNMPAVYRSWVQEPDNPKAPAVPTAITTAMRACPAKAISLYLNDVKKKAVEGTIKWKPSVGTVEDSHVDAVNNVLCALTSCKSDELPVATSEVCEALPRILGALMASEKKFFDTVRIKVKPLIDTAAYDGLRRRYSDEYGTLSFRYIWNV